MVDCRVMDDNNEQRMATFWRIAYEFGEWAREHKDLVSKNVRAYALNPGNTPPVRKSLTYLVRFHDEMLDSRPTRARKEGLTGLLAPHFGTGRRELKAEIEFATLFLSTSLSFLCSQPKGRSDTEEHWRTVARRHKIRHKPDEDLQLITSLRAVEMFAVSRATIRRAVADRRLKDHRAPGHAPNSPLLLDKAELACCWNPK